MHISIGGCGLISLQILEDMIVEYVSLSGFWLLIILNTHT
jgi:hypothetical protein